MSVDHARRIDALPEANGYRVPWFVAWIDGQPDFRVMDGERFGRALAEKLCWICGERLGRFVAFTIGPMCAVNRVSAEPPSHRDCAVYAATHCPFLVNPKKRRREGKMPVPVSHAGNMIERNPGVALVWVTRSFEPFHVPGGMLILIGQPTDVLWFAEGRPATRAEVEASIESGMPILEAAADDEGPDARARLETMAAAARSLIPAEVDR